MTVYTDNKRASPRVAVPEAPKKEDGTNYKYRMFFEYNSKIVDTDSLEDALHSIIRGYKTMTAGQKHQARVEYAIGQHFNYIIHQSVNNPEFNNLEIWEKKVFLGEKTAWKEDPKTHTAEMRDTKIWTADFPLVVIDYDYAPYTLDMMPTSGNNDGNNIVVLKTLDEKEFLDSLTILGVITFGTPKT